MQEIVIKTTTRCNLNCLYCNVEENEPMDITIDGVKNFLSFVSKSFPGEIIKVRWHGGEPLLLGYAFFKEAFEIQEKLPSVFENELSTNLTLLDDTFIKLFCDYDVTIKTSLDGLDSNNDLQRSNSRKVVIFALEELKTAGFKKVHIKSTFSKHNIGEITVIYKYCCSLPFIWEFSTIIPAGLKQREASELLVDPTVFSKNVIGIFEYWFENSPIDIPLFSNTIKLFIQPSEFKNKSMPRLGIGPDENIYKCPLLIGNRNHKIGHYSSKNSLKNFQSIDCSWKHLSHGKCNKCKYARICRINSCAYLAVASETHTGLAEYLCSSWEPVYDYIFEKVGGALDKIII